MAAADFTNSPQHWVEAAVAAGTGLPGQAAVTSLTGAVGTPGDAIVDVTGTPTQATINNNFASIRDKLNLVITRLRAVGIIIT